MRKLQRRQLRLIFGVLVPLLVTGLVVGQQKKASDGSLSIVTLSVDKTLVSPPCPSGADLRYRDCPDGMIVNVKTEISGKARKRYHFDYMVTDGKIIGSGQVVKWDLSNTPPGTYQISVTATNGADVLQSPSPQIVAVYLCPGCTAECLGCPDLSMSRSKETVNAGDTIDFWIDRPADTDGYVWTVSGGKVVKGLDSPRITVKTDNKARLLTVQVRAKVPGPCGDICPISDPTSVQVSPVGPN